MIRIVTPEEHRNLEYFFCRTWGKLPGLFVPKFWSDLIPPAIYDEPAIFHAIIALSLTHKADLSNTRGKDMILFDDLERTALLHYSKSIRLLQPHLNSGSQSSTRTSLITCLIFVFLEYLRGHYSNGHMHLINGLQLLQSNMGQESSAKGPDTESSQSSTAYTDEWIRELFFRVHVQSNMLCFRLPNVIPFANSFPRIIGTGAFQSIDEARNELDQAIMAMTEVKSQLESVSQDTDNPYHHQHHHHQKEIQSMLKCWIERYRLTHSDPHRIREARNKWAYQMLLVRTHRNR
jgi:uncharacterized protein (UPF0147 family)